MYIGACVGMFYFHVCFTKWMDPGDSGPRGATAASRAVVDYVIGHVSVLNRNMAVPPASDPQRRPRRVMIILVQVSVSSW